MKPCQRFKESLFLFFDDELDILRKKELQQHLSECPHCTLFLDRMRRMRSHLRELPSIKISDNFHILVRERIRRDLARQNRRRQSSVITVRRLVPAFGIAVLVIAIGYWVLDRGVSPDGSPSNGMRAVNQPSERFEGEIQYVIDDIPSRISVSRQDGESRFPYIGSDSLESMDRADEIRVRPTPVSF